MRTLGERYARTWSGIALAFDPLKIGRVGEWRRYRFVVEDQGDFGDEHFAAHAETRRKI